MKADDIKIDLELFEVDVLWTERKVPCIKSIKKITIKSLPKLEDRNSQKSVLILEDGTDVLVERNLQSKNIYQSNCSLDRWFKTREEADLYAKRIHAKELSYAEKLIVEDSEQVKKNSTPIRTKISFAERFKSALSFV